VRVSARAKKLLRKKKNESWAKRKASNLAEALLINERVMPQVCLSKQEEICSGKTFRISCGRA